MGKPAGHTLKDVTINQTNGNIMRHLDLNKNLVEDKSPEVLDKKDSKKKGKLPKIETANTLKSSGRAKSARPRFRRNSTAQEPASRQSPPCSSKIKIENCKLEDSPLLQPKQEPAQSSAGPKSERVREPELIVMSCLNCYLHVMVCDDNPKCPKCRRGDGLLDMYR